MEDVVNGHQTKEFEEVGKSWKIFEEIECLLGYFDDLSLQVAQIPGHFPTVYLPRNRHHGSGFIGLGDG
uniref:Ovule protein n=1 Tax=Angiostrongylus cantonensis TaxID=6313 RepID=A0A0K0D760_ANGCA